MPYIIKAKWYVRTVCSHPHSSGGMHGSHWCKFILSSLRLNLPPVPVQQPENLKGKFICPSLEALTKESCSDACDAENGLQLLLTEKFPFDGKADSPLSAASTKFLSNTSLAQVIAVSWIHQTLANHFASPPHFSFLLASARSPFSLFLSLSFSLSLSLSPSAQYLPFSVFFLSASVFFYKCLSFC